MNFTENLCKIKRSDRPFRKRFFIDTFVDSNGDWNVDYVLLLGGLRFDAINYSYCYYADRNFYRCFDHCCKGLSFDTFRNDFTDAEILGIMDASEETK